MNTKTSFTWIEAYEAIANKLLIMRDSEQALLDICKGHADMGDTSRMDPFTFMSLFNRLKKPSRRTEAIKDILDRLDIKVPLPTDYDGVPTSNPQKWRYMDGLDSSIDEKWDLFESAMSYSSKAEDNTRFAKLFDLALKQRNIGFASITIALFWCRPDTFIAYDSNNKKYLQDSFGLTLSEETGNGYLGLLEQASHLNRKFYEISADAFQYKEPNPTTSFGSIGHGGWLLVASPSIWAPSSKPIGSDDTYTVFNESGNPRRIHQNYLDTKKGDLVVAYESSPTKKAVSLLEITNDCDGKNIFFKKVADLPKPLTLNEIRTDSTLSNMQFISNPNGSLFKLTSAELKRILEMSDLDQNHKIESSKGNKSYTDDDFLEEVYLEPSDLKKLKRLLSTKRNLILDGAPGTGKTFCAKRLAWDLMGKRDDSRIETVQFHQGTTYEDFVIGYRPNQTGGFDITEGTFTKFCRKAAANPSDSYFFLIDEINRANVSKVFGELLSLIETDQRGNSVSLGIDGRQFFVPKNVYIIGTMNTADRSIAFIDYALRRRFSFFRMHPAYDNGSFLNQAAASADKRMPKLVEAVRTVNENIVSDPALGDGYVIGHSYLCRKDEGCVDDIVEFELIPLINEYWFDDHAKAQSAIEILRSSVNA